MNNGERAVSSESYRENNYEDVLSLVRQTDIVPELENNEWTSAELERKLSKAVKDAGEKALKDNNGIIYTTLSGGVDSTLALAILREELGLDVPIVTFTLGGSEEHPDVQFAREAAKKYGTDHHEYIPTPDDLNQSLEKYKTLRPGEDVRAAVKTGNFDIFYFIGIFRVLAQNH